MILSLIAIGIVGLVAYLWVIRGFFSALIHMICTVAAGAIAFAVWEPMAHWFLNAAPDRGFGTILGDSAYALGLALPFAVSLAVLRIALDMMLRANMKLNATADYIGGGICGVIAGTITAGIAVMCMGFMRMDSDTLGYAVISYGSQGNLKREGGLLFPVDKITTKLYGHLSRTSMYNGEESFGRLYPEAHEMAVAMRLNHGEGAARNTVKPADVQILDRFVVGESGSIPTQQLLADSWNSAAQNAKDLDDQNFPAGSRIEGFKVKFGPGTKERGGDNKILFTNAQIWLVCENASTGESKVVYPIAASGQAEAASPTRARFRFDAKQTPMASTGGASDATFDVEFVVPKDYKGIALYVKGARYWLEEGKLAQVSKKYADTTTRDQDLAQGSAITTQMEETDGPVIFPKPQGLRPGQAAPQIEGLRITNGVGEMLNKTVLRTIDTDDKNRIIDGEQTLTADEMKNIPTERTLRVELFAVTNETVIVQVDVGPSSKMSLLGKSAAMAEEIAPLLLVDTNGQIYEPVGYVYQDGIKNQKTIRFTPNAPVRALKEIPNLSRSRPNDRLMLVFRVSLGVSLKQFKIGNKIIAEFPEVKLDQPQNGR